MEIAYLHSESNVIFFSCRDLEGGGGGGGGAVFEKRTRSWAAQAYTPRVGVSSLSPGSAVALCDKLCTMHEQELEIKRALLRELGRHTEHAMHDPHFAQAGAGAGGGGATAAKAHPLTREVATVYISAWMLEARLDSSYLARAPASASQRTAVDCHPAPSLAVRCVVSRTRVLRTSPLLVCYILSSSRALGQRSASPLPATSVRATRTPTHTRQATGGIASVLFIKTVQKHRAS